MAASGLTPYNLARVKDEILLELVYIYITKYHSITFIFFFNKLNFALNAPITLTCLVKIFTIQIYFHVQHLRV